MSVEPVVAPPPGNRRFPLFDSLRAIAALAVFTTHVGFLTGANLHAWYGPYTARLDVGVTIFFLISGFLLYRPYVFARLHDRRPPRTRDYARRRLLRIVPAYWLALTVLAIYPGLPQMFSDHSWAYYLFLQNYFPAWTLGGITPTWSLAVEASFYVALPLIALFIRQPQFGRRPEARLRSELWMLAFFYLATIAFRVLLKANEGSIPASNLYNTLLGTLDWFALGMLLAVLSAWYDHREDRPLPIRLVERFPSACWGISLLLLWLVSTQIGITADFPQQYSAVQWLAEHVIYALIGFFLLLPAVFGDALGGLPRLILRNRVLAWLGLISYGIFLWHLPLVGRLADARTAHLWKSNPMLLLFVVGLALTVAVSAVSYYAFERPILRFKDRGVRDRELAGPSAGPATAGEASGIAG